MIELPEENIRNPETINFLALRIRQRLCSLMILKLPSWPLDVLIFPIARSNSLQAQKINFAISCIFLRYVNFRWAMNNRVSQGYVSRSDALVKRWKSGKNEFPSKEMKYL